MMREDDGSGVEKEALSMIIHPSEFTARVYASIRLLAVFNYQTPGSLLPANGIYFFFEEGETIPYKGRQWAGWCG